MEDTHRAPAEHHLTPRDVAERFGVSVGTVYQWNGRRSGPPYMRVGKYARYRLADVEAWEKARYVGPKVEAAGA